MNHKSFSYTGIIIGIIIVPCILCLVLFASRWTMHVLAKPNPLATAILTILEAPSPTNTPQPSANLTPSPTVQNVPSPIAGNISVNSFVQVLGTQGDGLRLREEPGLGNTVLTLASDNDIFKVLEGPSQADGLVWWYISDPYNEQRRGWSVANYLALVQQP